MKEWIKACKDGSPTTCNFGYSGALTEAVLLGNVAYRVGKKLPMGRENMKAVNSPRRTSISAASTARVGRCSCPFNGPTRDG